MFVGLSGRATILVKGGPIFDVGPGDVCVLTEGARTTWTVHETLRKVHQVTVCQLPHASHCMRRDQRHDGA